MSKRKVLFICVHNSARSQMAEAFLKKYGGEAFEVESAGLEPTAVNPLVVEAMKEKGVDLSGKGTQNVFDLYKAGRLFDYVVTVCDESSERRCPLFPGVVRRDHWPFADPAAASGDHEEKLAQVRVIRDTIEGAVRKWVDEVTA